MGNKDFDKKMKMIFIGADGKRVTGYQINCMVYGHWGDQFIHADLKTMVENGEQRNLAFRKLLFRENLGGLDGISKEFREQLTVRIEKELDICGANLRSRRGVKEAGLEYGPDKLRESGCFACVQNRSGEKDIRGCCPYCGVYLNGMVVSS